MSDKKETINLSSALNINEFNAVLRLCRERYNALQKYKEHRKEFQEKTTGLIENIGGNMNNAPDEIKDTHKLITDKLTAKAIEVGDEKFYKEFKEDIEDIEYITEVLRKFGVSEDYPDLDYKFLTDKFN